jgi:hypothetical protein
MIFEYADLEIGLHRREARSYSVEFRFSQPNSEADVRIGSDRPAQLDIDLEQLNLLAHNPPAYSEKRFCPGTGQCSIPWDATTHTISDWPERS